MAKSIADRLSRKIQRTATCWLWTGKRDVLGYGSIWLNGRTARAHRVAYELWVGPIPVGLELDHLCRVPSCVRPAHLEAVTHRENMRRGVSPAAHALRYDECVNGHALDAANTYRPPGDPGRRMCRVCSRRNLAASNARLGRRRGHY